MAQGRAIIEVVRALHAPGFRRAYLGGLIAR
jgi:hypothetical protein